MPAEFIDQVTLHLAAGDGGDGCASVRREKFKPLAGPDGGNGGNGGSIILLSDPQVTTLLGFHRQPHQRADSGGAGMGDYRSGTTGVDLVLHVPVGTVVRDASGTVIADLTAAGTHVVVAEGGRGGLGNAALANPKRRAPGFALLGTPGWQGDVVLELKTVADVALVGFPSAGKSSLIASVSGARPKIADYPFTTLAPNLGVVQAGDARFTIADVPGLIPGASKGKGLGLEFLRHIERCSVIVHVLDCATLEPGRDPLTDLDAILTELAAYPVPEGQTPLVERPAVVALAKVDVPEARDLAEFVAPLLEERGFRVFPVSAVSHAGLREWTFALGSLVEKAREARRADDGALLRKPILRARPDGPDFTVEKTTRDGEAVFWVRGAKPERWVAQTDFDNDEAVGYLADRLHRLGVEDRLAELGAEPGATVVIGGENGYVFDWDPSIVSAAEVVVAPRGTDPRIDPRIRASRQQRRRDYHDLMDAKAAARAELEAERRGHDGSPQDGGTVPDKDGRD